MAASGYTAAEIVLIAGLLLAYPALTTAIALLRAERRLGKLFLHIVTAFDRQRRR
jgi:hypothetical protein